MQKIEVLGKDCAQYAQVVSIMAHVPSPEGLNKSLKSPLYKKHV
jgi:hypothetical protein